MYDAIPLILAALIAVAIIVIGCFYLASPERVLGSFGLKPPASDVDTRAWLRPKGIRDVASGLVVLTMMLTADRRLVGTALLVFRHHPFWRHVNCSGVGRVEVASVLHARRNLRGDASPRPLVDPCHLREMPLTALVDREERIAISHAGDFGLLIFEAVISALLAE
jgi:hypothetical protein